MTGTIRTTIHVNVEEKQEHASQWSRQHKSQGTGIPMEMQPGPSSQHLQRQNYYWA